MSEDIKQVEGFLAALDDAVKRQDHIAIHVIRRTLESLPIEAVEAAIDLHLGTGETA